DLTVTGVQTCALPISAVREARSKVQPDLFIEGRHADITKMNGDNTVRVGVTFPLFDLGRANGDTRVAMAGLQEQEAVLAGTIRRSEERRVGKECGEGG